MQLKPVQVIASDSILTADPQSLAEKSITSMRIGFSELPYSYDDRLSAWTMHRRPIHDACTQLRQLRSSALQLSVTRSPSKAMTNELLGAAPRAPAGQIRATAGCISQTDFRYASSEHCASHQSKHRPPASLTAGKYPAQAVSITIVGARITDWLAPHTHTAHAHAQAPH